MNPWEIVLAHLEINETNYKGTKNVNRMRELIITRKNDFNSKLIKK
jgi:hypothetical protein